MDRKWIIIGIIAFVLWQNVERAKVEHKEVAGKGFLPAFLWWLKYDVPIARVWPLA